MTSHRPRSKIYSTAKLVTAPLPVQSPALTEDLSEWPAHGQRHCSNSLIDFADMCMLLCDYEQVALRKVLTHPTTIHSTEACLKVCQSSCFLWSACLQLPASLSNVLHSSCFKIMKYTNKYKKISTYYIILPCQTQAHKIRCIFLYCVYSLQIAKNATTLNRVNVCLCVCVCVLLLSHVQHHMNHIS